MSEEKYYSFIEQLAEIIQPEHVAFNFTEVEAKFQERNLSMENLMLKVDFSGNPSTYNILLIEIRIFKGCRHHTTFTLV